MKNNRIYINLHNKLSLPEAHSSSRLLFTLFHAALTVNWLFVFMHLYPIAALLPAIVILAIEYKRKTAFTNSALKFAISRLFIHVALIFSACVYIFIETGEVSVANQAWFLLSYLLVPLSGYDAYCTSKGGLGLDFIRPVKESIRRRS